jgi:hypothetical protein
MRLVDSCRSEKMKAYVPTQRMVYFLHKFEQISTVSFLEMLALFGKRSTAISVTSVKIGFSRKSHFLHHCFLNFH